MCTKIQNIFSGTFSKAAWREVSWYSISQAYTLILSYVGIMLISRYFGPTNLGLFSFVQNYVSVFFTILAGADFYFNWKLARGEHPATIMYNYMASKLVMLIFIIGVGAAASWIILPSDVALISTLYFLPLIFSALTPFYSYCLREKLAKRVAAITLLSATFVFISKVLVVYFDLGLKAFAVISSLDVVIIHTLAAFYFLQKSHWRSEAKKHFNTSLKSILELLKLSSLSVVYLFLWQLVIRADQLMLPAIKDAHTLGVYAAAVKIAEVPNIILALFGMVIFSRMVSIVDSSFENEKRRVGRMLAVHIVLGLFLSAIIMFMAPVLIGVIFGSKFAEAVPILMVYAWTVPGLFVTNYFVSVFAAREKYKLLAVHAGIFAILTLGTLYICTVSFGVLGTAAASIITYSLSGISMYLLWRSDLDFKKNNS